MGSFMNGFDLSNYEYFERGSVEDEKKDDGEEVDAGDAGDAGDGSDVGADGLSFVYEAARVPVSS